MAADNPNAAKVAATELAKYLPPGSELYYSAGDRIHLGRLDVEAKAGAGAGGARTGQRPVYGQGEEHDEDSKSDEARVRAGEITALANMLDFVMLSRSQVSGAGFPPSCQPVPASSNSTMNYDPQPATAARMALRLNHHDSLHSQLVVYVRREAVAHHTSASGAFKLDKTTSTFSYTASLMGGSGYQTLWKADDVQGSSSQVRSKS